MKDKKILAKKLGYEVVKRFSPVMGRNYWWMIKDGEEDTTLNSWKPEENGKTKET